MLTTMVTLTAGQVYYVETPTLPPYMFRSGIAGTVPISPADNFVRITDDQEKLIFGWTRQHNHPTDKRQDRVIIEDDLEDKTSVVKVIVEDVDESSSSSEEEEVSTQQTISSDGRLGTGENTERTPIASAPPEESGSEPEVLQRANEAIDTKPSLDDLTRNCREPEAHGSESNPINVKVESSTSTPSTVSLTEENEADVQIEEMAGDNAMIQNEDVGAAQSAVGPPPMITEPSTSSSASSSSEVPNTAQKRHSDTRHKSATGNKRRAVRETFQGTSSSSASTSNSRVQSNQLVEFQANQQRQEYREKARIPDICRNQTRTYSTFFNTTLTADGGHIVLQGCGTIAVAGNLQTISLVGSGQFIMHGDVEEGIQFSGTGSVTVYGNVQRGINLSGMGDILVGGDVYGDIKLSGMGSVIVEGMHRSGRVLRSGMGSVQVQNLSHNY